MTLQVSCYFRIQAGEHLIVGLPGFRMSNGEPKLEGLSGQRFTVSWENTTLQRPVTALVLTVRETIQPADSEALTVTAPLWAGLEQRPQQQLQQPQLLQQM